MSIFGQERLNKDLFKPDQIGSVIGKFTEGRVGRWTAFPGIF